MSRQIVAPVELVGKVFGRLTVTAVAERRLTSELIMLECRCSCGKSHRTSKGNLLAGHAKSCGCLQREVGGNRTRRHGCAAGVKPIPEYNAWVQMVQRCHNPKNTSYGRYGGRGISVCDEWRGEQGFDRFIADMGRRPSDEHSIDRKENDGPYCKANCRWATRKEQGRNKRTSRMITVNGETLCLQEWSERLGVHPSAILARIKSGWSDERAVTQRGRFQ